MRVGLHDDTRDPSPPEMGGKCVGAVVVPHEFPAAPPVTDVTEVRKASFGERQQMLSKLFVQVPILVRDFVQIDGTAEDDHLILVEIDQVSTFCVTPLHELIRFLIVREGLARYVWAVGKRANAA